MGEPRVSYTTCPEATTQTEINALANVYRFVLTKANKNNNGVSSTSRDTTMKNNKEVSHVGGRTD